MGEDRRAPVWCRQPFWVKSSSRLKQPWDPSAAVSVSLSKLEELKRARALSPVLGAEAPGGAPPEVSPHGSVDRGQHPGHGAYVRIVRELCASLVPRTNKLTRRRARAARAGTLRARAPHNANRSAPATRSPSARQDRSEKIKSLITDQTRALELTTSTEKNSGGSTVISHEEPRGDVEHQRTLRYQLY
ncbi:hypothetical protein DNTS_009421 [Danionella cerebrum]|uniref:Uncharacterized protein n=1 Tax=Danionella cerebrum TaxID=2873325 RepID=A0A553NIB4_9TELE|nr:hypothetical protein DNTS_009421 [Danionella translucida]